MSTLFAKKVEGSVARLTYEGESVYDNLPDGLDKELFDASTAHYGKYTSALTEAAVKEAAEVYKSNKDVAQVVLDTEIGTTSFSLEVGRPVKDGKPVMDAELEITSIQEIKDFKIDLKKMKKEYLTGL